jgi:polyadenylate-binding protein
MAAPPAPTYPSASLYVGDLASDVSEGNLFEIFNAYGPVASIRVCRDSVTRRSLGYAYVNFHNPADAERALDTLNNTQIKGRTCRIMWSQRDPAIRKSGVGNIFIKNLDPSIDHKALYDTFCVFGNILSCKVMTDENNGSKGYAFVHFETQEMADRAIEKINGMILGNGAQPIYVGRFIARRERQKNQPKGFTNIYVKNIDASVNKEIFNETFSKFGNITNLALAEENGSSKGFGFINYEKPEDAQKSVEEMNGKDFHGKTLYVGRAQKKTERQQELKQKFEQLRQERAAKYQGVNLYIKNLDDDIDDEKIRAEFSQFGNITSVKVMRDEKTNSKGFGFVCFTTPEEAAKAVAEMNTKTVGSSQKPLYVALAQRKEHRKAQLAQQHAQRKAGNFPASGFLPPPMYAPGTPPVFYAQPPPQQFVYPPILPRNRYAPQTQYQPMPNYIPTLPVQRSRGGNTRQMPGRRFNHSRGPRDQNQNQPQGMSNIQPGSQSIPQNIAISSDTGAIIAPPVADDVLTAEMLNQFSPEDQTMILGERLFPLVQKIQPELAGKITGMLLDIKNEKANGIEQLLSILVNPTALQAKIAEAVDVLEQHSGADKE